MASECARGEDAIRLAREHRADVLLIDMEVPDIGGLEVARRLGKGDGLPQVILIGVHAEGPIPARALESGACGYLTRGCAPVEVVTAVRRAAEGRRYVDAEVAQGMVIDKLNPGSSPIATLTARELTVMVMVSNGYDRQTISERLCLSPKTVSTYRTRIMRKLGTSNDVELTPSILSARAARAARNRLGVAVLAMAPRAANFAPVGRTVQYEGHRTRPPPWNNIPPGSTRSLSFEPSPTIRVFTGCSIGSGASSTSERRAA